MEKIINPKTERNSNIELLRIILMFMVITLHFNNEGMGGAFNFVIDKKVDYYLLHFFESLSICAVNCFMVISGYFLAYNKKVKLGKILDLLLIVVFYRFFNYMLSVIIYNEPLTVFKVVSRLAPINYFALSYIVCYILSPFLAKTFDILSLKQQKAFVITIVSIFILYPTLLNIITDIAPSSKFGMLSISSGGTIQFIVCVIMGMYVRRNNFDIKTWKLLLLYFGSVLIMTVGVKKVPSLYYYDSVFVSITAVTLFMLFNKLKFSSKFVNFVSASVFGIYCCHVDPTMHELWKTYFITEKHIGSGTGNMLLWTVISVFVMFIVCLIIDILARYTIGFAKRKICSKCPVIIDLDKE